MSKATATNPADGYNRPKGRLMPSDARGGHPPRTKGESPPRDGPSWYQLDGGVTAHHGCDAYRACERGPAHWD